MNIIPHIIFNVKGFLINFSTSTPRDLSSQKIVGEHTAAAALEK